MNASKLQYVYWYLAYFAKKLGALGLIGLGLIMVSLFFRATEIPKIEALIKETQGAKEKLAANMHRNNDEVLESSATPSLNEIHRFYDIFPQAVALPHALATIDHIANQQKLVLNTGDYKFNKIKEAKATNEKKLTKYEIVLPVKGQYLQIQHFISEVLLQLPALALIDMQIHRENSLNQNVEAKLVFVIFVGGES